jgi:hypothetical protein
VAGRGGAFRPAAKLDPAFDILRQVLRRIHGSSAKQCERADLDAMFV